MKKYNKVLKRSIHLFPLCILFLLISCDTRKNGTEEAAAQATAFRVASYNIRYDAPADYETGNGWDIRKEPLAALILKHQFDIFGTQEGDKNQMSQLKELLPGYDYVAYPYAGKTSDLHTCATVYKTDLFEVLDSGVFWLSQTPDVPSIGWDATDRRICQWTKMRDKKNDRVFYFFNAHFYWRLKEAKRESGPLMVQKIKSIAGDNPVLCTGDFNSEPETPQIQHIKGLLLDAYDVSRTERQGVDETNISGGVFQGKPTNRIDHIFLSKHFIVADYQVLSDTYNGDHYPSDHLPVTSLVSWGK